MSGERESYDCGASAEQIDCPEICKNELPHQHWRCAEGHGWLMIPVPGGPDTPFFDLTQPARLIYPTQPKFRR